MNCEHQKGRSHKTHHVDQAQKQHLELQEKVALHFIQQKLLHLLEGEETAVYPPLSLPQKVMQSLNRIHLRKGVGKVMKFPVVVEDPQAQGSVLSKGDVLVVKEAFLAIFLWSFVESPIKQKVGQEYLQDGFCNPIIKGSQLRLGGVLHRFEVAFK